MKLSIGIVGLPNVGKSTLFKMITKLQVTIANYPFATIDPNVGVVPVPDERLDVLAKMSNSAKIVPAVVEFYDIAGLVKGANTGEGLGNQFLSHIRDVKAIVHVLRCFQSNEIIHVENSVDPIRDMEIINTELMLKDLETVQKRLSKLESEAKSGDKQKAKDADTLKKVKDGLEKGILVFNLPQEIKGDAIVQELNLLTNKNQIFLLNGVEEDVSEDLKQKIKSLGFDYVIADLMLVDDVDFLIKKAYEVLGLISFFTTGETESRAWTIEKGTKAPQAAGVIHSDFEKKFIRAEVVAYDKLVEAARSAGSGSTSAWAAAKQKGWFRLEGKEYVFQDADVVEFRHG